MAMLNNQMVICANSILLGGGDPQLPSVDSVDHVQLRNTKGGLFDKLAM